MKAPAPSSLDASSRTSDRTRKLFYSAPVLHTVHLDFDFDCEHHREVIRLASDLDQRHDLRTLGSPDP